MQPFWPLENTCYLSFVHISATFSSILLLCARFCQWLLVFVVLFFLEVVSMSLSPWWAELLTVVELGGGQGVVVIVHHLCLSVPHMLDSSVIKFFHLIGWLLGFSASWVGNDGRKCWPYCSVRIELGQWSGQLSCMFYAVSSVPVERRG